MNLNRQVISEIKTNDANEMEELVAKLKSVLIQPACILLNGELAAGKTTFVQKFAESYLLKNVSSPTFSLHQVYKNESIQIEHFDLYRLQTDSEIETCGLWDVFSLEKAVVFIEWARRISELDLPQNWNLFEIDFTKLSENQRTLKLSRLFS